MRRCRKRVVWSCSAVDPTRRSLDDENWPSRSLPSPGRRETGRAQARGKTPRRSPRGLGAARLSVGAHRRQQLSGCPAEIISAPSIRVARRQATHLLRMRPDLRPSTASGPAYERDAQGGKGGDAPARLVAGREWCGKGSDEAPTFSDEPGGSPGGGAADEGVLEEAKDSRADKVDVCGTKRCDAGQGWPFLTLEGKRSHSAARRIAPAVVGI